MPTATSNSASSSGSNASSSSTRFSYIKTAHNKLNKLTSGGTNNSSSTVKASKKASTSTAASNTFFNTSLTGTMMPSVASRLKKNFSRTKEKILQGMGKTDRTNDHNFDLYVENFEKQSGQASKLTKELNKYLNCLRETQKSSRVFYETLRDTYEQAWPDSEIFTEQIQLMENKWHDYIIRLSDDVQYPLIAYLNEFPELKKKIEKRGNRLLDYDDARHTLENLQIKTAKKSAQASVTVSNETNGNGGSGAGSSSSTSTTSSSTPTTDQLTKLTKLKIDLEDKQNVYEEINQTLCMALPVLYENRIKFYSSLFQTFFHTETIFHSDCAEIKSKLDDICENLSKKTVQQTSYQSSPNNEHEANDSDKENGLETLNNLKNNEENLETNKCSPSRNISEFIPSSEDFNLPRTNLNSAQDEKQNFKISELEIKNPDMSLSNLKRDEITNEETNSNLINSNNSGINENFECLYTVRATYAYEAKEIDELTFTKDDIIQVVEGTSSEKEDLDDGWLIGIHLVTHKRGLFPENFTKRI